jgi:flagellar biosynthesis/type III secretory pathway protein FliH
MKASRARVIKADALPGSLRPPDSSPTTPPRLAATVIPRVIAEARAQAETILERANEEASAIRAQAEAKTHEASLRQQARARADALSLVVNHALELRKRRVELDEGLLDRSVALATLLAERLLGEQLSLEPSRIAALARQAILEAAGARRAIVVAHPVDAQHLKAELTQEETLLEALVVQEDESLSPGHIRVETELGVIEADVRGQLQRLAVQLRKLLRH